MPINRTPFNLLVDDAGTGTTGTPWNKQAIKDVILDPVDAAAGGTVTLWTPIDGSGSTLALTVTSARYVLIGRVIVLAMDLQYPTVTADGRPAIISGLPAPPVGASGLYPAFPTALIFYIATGTSYIQIFDPTNGVALTNTQLSGRRLIVGGSYIS